MSIARTRALDLKCCEREARRTGDAPDRGSGGGYDDYQGGGAQGGGAQGGGYGGGRSGAGGGGGGGRSDLDDEIPF